jgi:hypothetical protein
VLLGLFGITGLPDFLLTKEQEERPDNHYSFHTTKFKSFRLRRVHFFLRKKETEPKKSSPYITETSPF